MVSLMLAEEKPYGCYHHLGCQLFIPKVWLRRARKCPVHVLSSLYIMYFPERKMPRILEDCIMHKRQVLQKSSKNMVWQNNFRCNTHFGNLKNIYLYLVISIHH